MHTTHYAAIDASNITGAVYAVSSTPAGAIAEAIEAAGHGPDYAGFAPVPCSARAAAYVAEHGGAPSAELVVTPGGVLMRSEECAECARHYGDGGPCDEGKPVASPHRARATHA